MPKVATKPLPACEPLFDYTGGNAIHYISQQIWNKDPLPPTVFTNTVLVQQYPNGTAAGSPIVLNLPCLTGYTDALSVHISVVDPNIPYNYFNDSISLSKLYPPVSTGTIVNWPIVTPGSWFTDASPGATSGVVTISASWPDLNGNSAAGLPGVKSAWYSGIQVYYADFGVINPGATVSNGASVRTNNAAQVYGSNGIAIGSAIMDVVNDTEKDVTYSGSYSISIAEDDTYQSDSLKSFDELTGKYTPIPPSFGTMATNCPTGLILHQ
ncbi:hypothetical protein HDU79_011402 [Rhizoclosmatium sp. JEL0117]|nr:hypothetical protein HDU79_011402 [Rhizoclosmatium sp. JEL0117]